MDLALVSLCWVRGEAQTCSLTDWRVGLNTDLQTPQWQCTGHSGDVIHIPPPVFSTVGERQKDQLWTDSTERWRTQDVLDTGADQWWRTDTGNYKPHRLVHAAKKTPKTLLWSFKRKSVFCRFFSDTDGWRCCLHQSLWAGMKTLLPRTSLVSLVWLTFTAC